jgi:hypothetical protein
MQLETKFLRLRTPVEVGSRFGDWQVCWLGGWARFRLYYLVMLVKVPLLRAPVVAGILRARRTIDLAFGEKRAMNSVAMNTFTIDTNNNITAFASLDDARAAKIHYAEYFGSPRNWLNWWVMSRKAYRPPPFSSTEKILPSLAAAPPQFAGSA